MVKIGKSYSEKVKKSKKYKIKSKLDGKDKFKSNISNKTLIEREIPKDDLPLIDYSKPKLSRKDKFKSNISNKTLIERENSTNNISFTDYSKPKLSRKNRFKSNMYKKILVEKKIPKEEVSLVDYSKPNLSRKNRFKSNVFKKILVEREIPKDDIPLIKYYKPKLSRRYRFKSNIIKIHESDNSKVLLRGSLQPKKEKKQLVTIENPIETLPKPNKRKPYKPLFSENIMKHTSYKFDFIEKVIYINLEKCVNRKKLVEAELLKYFPPEKIIRFNAIVDTVGAIGCTKSHIAVLELAISNNWENCLIVEDDLEWFPDNKIFRQAYNIFNRLIKIPNFDVIVLSSYCRINNPNTFKLTKCLTTGNYFVKNHYYETLLNNYKEGLELLIENKDAPNNIRMNYTIDFYWHKLQKNDNWYVVAPSLSVQRTDLSSTNGKIRVMNRKVYM